MRLLIVDNRDSFTWNLAELVRRVGGVAVAVCPADRLSVEEASDYDRIILSPGPGVPDEAGITKEVITRLGGRIPILGVCLGFQAIAEGYGGTLYNLGEVYHGRTTCVTVLDRGSGLFEKVPSLFRAGLYHSWAVDRESLPPCLIPEAVSVEGILMALRHRTDPVCGVQFHPESVMTPLGLTMMRNWLTNAGAGPRP